MNTSDLADSSSSRTVDERTEGDFLREVIQPGLAGLMDGSVSTLAPLFAAAFATEERACADLESWSRELMASSGGVPVSPSFGPMPRRTPVAPQSPEHHQPPHCHPAAQWDSQQSPRGTE